jgi:hypothetical protein
MQMSFKENYPDYVAVEEYVRRARLERSIAVGNLVAAAVVATWAFMKKVADTLVDAFHSNEAAEHDRQAIEANTFLKRSVPR